MTIYWNKSKWDLALYMGVRKNEIDWQNNILIKMKNKKLNDNRTLFIKLTVCRDHSL